MRLIQEGLLDFAHWKFRLAEDARREGKLPLLEFIPEAVFEAWHRAGLDPSVKACAQRGLFSDST